MSLGRRLHLHVRRRKRGRGRGEEWCRRVHRGLPVRSSISAAVSKVKVVVVVVVDPRSEMDLNTLDSSSRMMMLRVRRVRRGVLEGSDELDRMRGRGRLFDSYD